MFKAPFLFKGRIRRLEYGLSYIVYSVLSGLMTVITKDMASPGYINFLVHIPLVCFLLAQGVKRCQDLGNSGWFQLIPIYILWLIIYDSHPGENQYGENPKGIENAINDIDKIGAE
jgi:uncharacterized membrane protein YhaH (DUF805 family)